MREINSPSQVKEYLHARFEGSHVDDIIHNFQNTHRDLFKEKSVLENTFVAESVFYMKNQLLRDADWASMYHSVELRVPFCNSRTFALSADMIRSNKKIIGKSLLARMPQSNLPDNLFSRPKTGFNIPGHNIVTTKNSIHWSKDWACEVLQHYRS